MTASNDRTAPQLLSRFELIHEILLQAGREGDIDALAQAMKHFYLAHGAAFGRTKKGLKIWFEYGQATTIN